MSALHRFKIPLRECVPFTLQNFFWAILFLFSIAFTLCQGTHLWLARIGWVLLAILFSLHRRYAVYTVFFYASFFHPAGFLPNAPMTLKHFHIACILLMTTDMLRGNFVAFLKQGKVFGKVIAPFVLMLVFGCMVSLRSGFSINNFRLPLNLFVVLFALCYLYGCVVAIRPAQRPGVVRRSLLALCVGAGAQVAVAIANNLEGTAYWHLVLFYNHHLGNLCLFAFFYIFPIYATSKKPTGKAAYFLLLIIIFTGLITSCSRTVWICCLAGFFLFMVISRYSLGRNVGRFAFYRHVVPAALCLYLAFFLLMLKSETVMARVVLMFQRVLDPRYWLFTIADEKNFGCLGILRLNDYALAKQLLFHHGLWGVGFLKQVTDMHGVPLVILGASGILGFSLYVWFIVRYSRKISRAFNREHSEECLLLLVGAFSNFVAWLLMSFAETFVVHFVVWVNVLLGVLLAEMSLNRMTFEPGSPERLASDLKVNARNSEADHDE